MHKKFFLVSIIFMLVSGCSTVKNIVGADLSSFDPCGITQEQFQEAGIRSSDISRKQQIGTDSFINYLNRTIADPNAVVKSAITCRYGGSGLLDLMKLDGLTISTVDWQKKPAADLMSNFLKSGNLVDALAQQNNYIYQKTTIKGHEAHYSQVSVGGQTSCRLYIESTILVNSSNEDFTCVNIVNLLNKILE